MPRKKFDEILKRFNFADTPTKVYDNGKKGEYLCSCIRCKKTFVGAKWDPFCTDCDMQAGEEFKTISEVE